MTGDLVYCGENVLICGINLFNFRHPIVAFFHVFFRAAAVVVYMLCGIFGAGFVPSFVTVVILLSLDFWTVKNITGEIG